MSRKRKLGYVYVKDLEHFEIFVKEISSFLFQDIRKEDNFHDFIKTRDDAKAENLDDELLRIHRRWYDETTDFFEEFIYVYDDDDFEDRLVGNVAVTLSKNVVHDGSDLSGAIDTQLRRYCEDKLDEDGPIALFRLLVELEKKYGKSQKFCL